MLFALLLLAAAPKPGTYVLNGGDGTLVLTAKTFKIDVVGANAHICGLAGSMKGSIGTEDECTVDFTEKGDGLEVSTKTADACREYCGARAWFEGQYSTLKPQCTAPKVKATRAQFNKHYAAKAYADAKADLEPLLADCTPVLSRFELWWILNDLAITQHKAGDDAACLKTLEPLKDLAETPEEEVGGTEPSFADALKKIAKATRTNVKLCTKK